MGKHEHTSPFKFNGQESPMHIYQMRKRARSSASEEDRRMSVESSEPAQEQEAHKPLTLLQKAEKFRKEHEEKWHQRELALRQRSLELKGFITPEPVIKWYNKKVAEERKNSLEQEKLRRLEPRKLTAHIQFVKSDYLGADTMSLRSSDRASISSNSSNFDTRSLVELKHDVGDDDRDKESFELLITVEVGLNLHNGVIKDEDRMEKCHVRLFVFPDEEKKHTAQKSSYRFITTKGVTRWDHQFVIKGLSQKLLRSRYVVLTLTGKNNSKKMNMGQVILAGDQAKIKSERQMRSPTTEEKDKLMEAINNPECTVSDTLDLDEEDYVSVASHHHKGNFKHLKLLRKSSVKKDKRKSADLS